MKRGSTDNEPTPWDAIIRGCRENALIHRLKGEVGYAEAEERLALYCEHRSRAERLRPGEPPIPGVTCEHESS